ncbi:DUF3828 domain-containing protein [Acetobacter peroxydans]|jgi:hypothetical protein|uniref:DUF3828 domain-containing protein n=1 Tax=Acetobacter peroxydans TaxID=104098 RepID=UPI002352DF64|nr:DUF3828 domain-containing protein [Acetobacter peroxydans]MCI1439125.1 YbjP/YqhG family protein [Acetobacter peroxydans]MCI1567521.1 YbjP/YqhG family protein [Acetobacter peroxydans]MCI1726011.1 YbjP/YqhG family protein [Acetobacter peroxydans]
MVALEHQTSSREPCTLDRHIAVRNQAIKSSGIRYGRTLLNACILTFFPFCTYAQSATPDKIVLEFYTQYMSTCDQPFDRPPGSISESLFFGLDIDKYITKKLQEKITAAYNSGKYGDLAGDADYFTHTQDFDAHLTSSMKAKVIKEDRKRAIVRLLVDLKTNFAKPFAVCVRLQREGNNWKIYQVDPSLDNNLPDCKGS